MDLGTTTVVIAGFAFYKGAEDVVCIGKKSALNAQTGLGRDVMMRIMHAVSGKRKELQQMIVAQIEALAKEILESAGISAVEAAIRGKTEFIIVGNTTMSH
ncbi:MAG: hypothetical protein IJ733_21225 [Lachnospiraceae bacterium]|nr:hypothetical protein [Lachnospiraceae bacterium]